LRCSSEKTLRTRRCCRFSQDLTAWSRHTALRCRTVGSTWQSRTSLSRGPWWSARSWRM
jgi:hypothetical protein